MSQKSRIACGIVAAAMVLGSASPGAAATTDRSFGEDGVRFLDLADGERGEVTFDVVALQDGAVIAGVISGTLSGDFAASIVRLTPSGEPDPGFGDGGTAPLPVPRFRANVVAVTPTDRILIAGTGGDTTRQVIVAALTAAGEPDASFGQNGFARLDIALPQSGGDVDMGVDPDGRIVLSTGTGTDGAIARLTPNGDRDAAFGTSGDGTVLVDLGGGQGDIEGFVGLVLDGTRPVALGRGRNANGDIQATLVRLTPGGKPDPTFGSNGSVTVAESPDALARGADGRLVTATRNSGGDNVNLRRYLADGTPDLAFAGGTVVSVVPPPAFVTDVAIAADGSVLVGSVRDFLTGGLVSRFTPDGRLDTAFGCSGRVAVDGFDRPQVVESLAAGRDGEILVGGGGFDVREVGVRNGVRRQPVFVGDALVTRVSPADTGDVGYWLASAAGGVEAFGGAGACPSFVADLPASPIVGMVGTPSSDGFTVVAADGGVFTSGDAPFHGSLGGQALNAPVVGVAADPDGSGYWLVGADGGVFAFDAPALGSLGGRPPNAPIVGIAATRSGNGYWLVAADGGVFTFGDARFAGSTGDIRLNQPVVSMAADPDSGGYWLVARDGGIFSFGGAGFAGSTGGARLNQPVVGIAADPDGSGYWLAAADGGVFSFDARFVGSVGRRSLRSPVVGVAPTR